MPVSLPADYMAVAFHHDGGNVTGEMINTQAFSLSGYANTAEEALDEVSGRWAAGPHQRHVGTITYVKASAMYNDPILGLRAMESTIGSIAGSASAPPMPLNVAVIVQKTTAFAGRKFRGRLFFGGMAAATLALASPNELDTSEKGTLQSRFDDFKSENVAVGIVPVLLHQVGGPTPTLITSFDVHALVGTMRKRIR